MAFRIFKYISVVLVVSVLAGCAPGIKGHFKISPEYSYNPKMRVAVIPFSSEGSVENGNGEKIANLISTELIPYYLMVEREQINNILKQIGFEIGGAVSDTTLPKLGKMLGVEAVVLGNVYEHTSKRKAGRKVYRISANIRMVDIETSALIWSINCKLEHGEKSMHDFCEVYSAKFAKKLYRELNRSLKKKH